MAIIGLVPLALAPVRPGKEILHPLAVVVIGGLLDSTLLDQSSRRRCSSSSGGELNHRGTETQRRKEEKAIEQNDCPAHPSFLPLSLLIFLFFSSQCLCASVVQSTTSPHLLPHLVQHRADALRQFLRAIRLVDEAQHAFPSVAVICSAE